MCVRIRRVGDMGLHAQMRETVTILNKGLDLKRGKPSSSGIKVYHLLPLSLFLGPQ